MSCGESQGGIHPNSGWAGGQRGCPDWILEDISRVGRQWGRVARHSLSTKTMTQRALNAPVSLGDPRVGG